MYLWNKFLRDHRGAVLCILKKIKFFECIIFAVFILLNALVSTTGVVCRRLRISRLMDTCSEYFGFGRKCDGL